MKKIIFILPCMSGGGAERVAAQLLNKIHSCGYDAEFVLTSQKLADAVNTDLDKDIPLVSLYDNCRPASALNKILIILSSLLCKPFEILKLNVPAYLALFSFRANYYNQLKAMKEYLSRNEGSTVVTFLQPSIPLVMLASRGLDVRVIFSERGDARRLMNHRYGRNFISKFYTRADVAVFQTLDAMFSYPHTYPGDIVRHGTIISNPIKENLPEAWHGGRNKNITTFCRISRQKNLPLLINAFVKVHALHHDYKLRIIGDTINAEGEAVLTEIKAIISENNLTDAVIFEPFRNDVHSAIINDAMYVNSSDYEGISNAMLESMAIGLPVVCTDCPVGGARQTITDGINGLLVPCNDAQALASAICRIIEKPDLADTLSQNASEIRNTLSLDKITDKWIDLL